MLKKDNEGYIFAPYIVVNNVEVLSSIHPDLLRKWKLENRKEKIDKLINNINNKK